ncbi:MAG: hypothetical protein CVV02_08770 [Firmicutes bacterium HGW-Firmicutes-7]|nr:MAG: hypothetical protein CVV02_08770 [Firmicutes bacterium HGW-Firmicutes-7]
MRKYFSLKIIVGLIVVFICLTTIIISSDEDGNDNEVFTNVIKNNDAFITYNIVDLLGNGSSHKSKDGIADKLIGYDSNNFSFANGEQTFTPYEQYGSMFYDIPATYKHIYYMCSYVKSNSSTAGIEFMDDPYFPISLQSGSGEFEFLSVLYEKILDDSNLLIAVLDIGTIFKPITFKNIHVMDLTEIFGVGNEPTIEYMDLIVKILMDHSDLSNSKDIALPVDFFANFDINKTYVAKLFPDINRKSGPIDYYEISYKDNKFNYKYIGSILISSSNEIGTLDFDVESNSEFTLSVLISNNDSSIKTFNVYKDNGKAELLYEETLEPNSEKLMEISINSREIHDNLNMTINIASNSEVIEKLIVIDDISTDIREHWAGNEIIDLMMKGIMFNKIDHQFFPDDAITRGEFITSLSKSLKLRKTEDQIKVFKDLNEEHQFYDYINIAASNGLVKGYPDGSIHVDNSIKRQDVALIISKVYEDKGIEIETTRVNESFVDYINIDNYAVNAMNWCINNGIINGNNDKKLEPDGNLTRAEAAILISRIIDDFSLQRMI